MPIDFDQARRSLVGSLSRRGIKSLRVLNAMGAVRREAFVAANLRSQAYDDGPLPIGREQTISQPYMVAIMAEALELRPEDRVLEIGAGSGYAAAVLAELAGEVYTIDRFEELAQAAAAALASEGYANVKVACGDGTNGWREHSPYDAILVSAGGPAVPQPLVDQLAEGGRLVIPVGEDRHQQHLLRVRKLADGSVREEDLGSVRFVPLIGAAGWDE